MIRDRPVKILTVLTLLIGPLAGVTEAAAKKAPDLSNKTVDQAIVELKTLDIDFTIVKDGLCGGDATFVVSQIPAPLEEVAKGSGVILITKSTTSVPESKVGFSPLNQDQAKAVAAHYKNLGFDSKVIISKTGVKGQCAHAKGYITQSISLSPAAGQPICRKGLVSVIVIEEPTDIEVNGTCDEFGNCACW